MKRFLTIFLFLIGGAGAELSNPVNCAMIHTSRRIAKRRTMEWNDG